ncbi:hypothetical protein ACPOL_6982 (plasmid) [Acidisarcina polymorpha]|uniref:Uncharacterized protein n=1 Tax=Acidisarcina polymorpha TaxID=2211140 RepID=A0A2Z5GC10_9BACT|nr:hypothetical protein [Acidisarcina polymorpha]AXC16186.1 hypothetical protein ACPOL_6982 [Acidisarcina polymorpha]
MVRRFQCTSSQDEGDQGVISHDSTYDKVVVITKVSWDTKWQASALAGGHLNKVLAVKRESGGAVAD